MVRIEDPSGPTEMNMQWSMMQASPILKDMHIHDTFNHQDGKLGSCSYYYYYSTIQELISSLEQDHFIWNMALEMPDGMMNNHTRFLFQVEGFVRPSLMSSRRSNGRHIETCCLTLYYRYNSQGYVYDVNILHIYKLDRWEYQNTTQFRRKQIS